MKRDRQLQDDIRQLDRGLRRSDPAVVAHEHMPAPPNEAVTFAATANTVAVSVFYPPADMLVASVAMILGTVAAETNFAAALYRPTNTAELIKRRREITLGTAQDRLAPEWELIQKSQTIAPVGFAKEAWAFNFTPEVKLAAHQPYGLAWSKNHADGRWFGGYDGEGWILTTYVFSDPVAFGTFPARFRSNSEPGLFPFFVVRDILASGISPL